MDLCSPARMIDVPKAWLQVVVQVDGGLTILRMRVEAKLNFRGCYAAKALVPADCLPIPSSESNVGSASSRLSRFCITDGVGDPSSSCPNRLAASLRAVGRGLVLYFRIKFSPKQNDDGRHPHPHH